MHILVLQHTRADTPGIFEKYLQRDGHPCDIVTVAGGADLPNLDGYDGLWVMGGPMDVWEDDKHPWLTGEANLIRHAVKDRKMPYLGIGLGHQLLARALDGVVDIATAPEVGVMEVELTRPGARAPIFEGLPPRFEVLQWHGAAVQSTPPMAEILAQSPACMNQAMQWGDRACSMQFHPEVEPGLITRRTGHPDHAATLQNALGPDAAGAMETACAEKMAEFNDRADRLYRNWMRSAAAT
jgi:GMP synthase-like glutamine amidotransferase